MEEGARRLDSSQSKGLLGISLNPCPGELKPRAEGGGDFGIVDDDADEFGAGFVLYDGDFFAVDYDFVFEGEVLARDNSGFAEFFFIEAGVGFGLVSAGDNSPNGDIGFDSGLDVVGSDPVVYFLIDF